MIEVNRKIQPHGHFFLSLDKGGLPPDIKSDSFFWPKTGTGVPVMVKSRGMENQESYVFRVESLNFYSFESKEGAGMVMDRYSEIDEAIAYIHQHIDEPLPLSRLAGHVAYSPYHFTRMFKERIGLSPLYYVSSLRLQKAKELLLRTNWSVRDIGLEIGQQSLGTFTTRFTERVGVTPSQFRNSALHADNHFRSLQKLNDWPASHSGSNHHARIEGTVQAVIPFEGVILIGLFAKPIPEGLPLHGTLLSSLGDFCFTDVKPGTYYLMATSVSWGMQAIDFLLPHTTLRTRSKEPISVGPCSTVPHQQVTLHVPRPDDPPILISLPLLMNNFLNRVIQHSNR